MSSMIPIAAFPTQDMPPAHLFAPQPIQAFPTAPEHGLVYYQYAPPPDYMVPSGFPVAAPETQPSHSEESVTLTNGDLTSTNVKVDNAKAAKAVHLNFHNNDIARVEGLERFPMLLRITLSTNNLTVLKGLESSPRLRWVDASNNDLKNLKGLSQSQSLEWLDVSTNDLTSLDGIGNAPNLTWINARNSDLKNLKDLNKVPLLKVLNVNSNNLRNLEGIEHCSVLQELHAKNNDLRDIKALTGLKRLVEARLGTNDISDATPLAGCTALRRVFLDNNCLSKPENVKCLAALPDLELLTLRECDFSDGDEKSIMEHFKNERPKAQVIFHGNIKD